MGGIGSGGARPGTGPKPKSAEARWLDGNSSKRGPKPAKRPQHSALPLLAAPSGLNGDEVGAWNELAPQACERRTLMPATAEAFRQLCERIVLMRRIKAAIEADGLMDTKVTLQMDEQGGGLQQVQKKAHDLLTKYMTLMQRVDAGMVRFGLAPVGKPLVEEPPEADDPFGEFDREPVQ